MDNTLLNFAKKTKVAYNGPLPASYRLTYAISILFPNILSCFVLQFCKSDMGVQQCYCLFLIFHSPNHISEYPNSLVAIDSN
jgi:hypothetical protein